jgi:serine/threonine protein kinase
VSHASCRCCSLQIHQLNSTWSESRKASYVRHAVREYTIHKALRHTNIVSLTDIFEVRRLYAMHISLQRQCGSILSSLRE